MKKNMNENFEITVDEMTEIKDDFPKDTMLYRYMTTKPEETLQN